jgi:hypothetical protein
MTLTKVCIMMAVIATVLTAIMYFLRNKEAVDLKSIGYSLFQNFVGAFFIFSGGVKVIDPYGTAYKLEQYFSEFESTFSETWMSWMSGIFPFFAEYALPTAILVIVFEIVLGLLLIIGHAKKFTHWSFLLLILFFTFLTGYTYLTGYIPNSDPIVLEKGEEIIKIFEGEEGDKLENGWTVKDTINANLFNLSSWGEWKETNMKVTDCGCFGDFLVLSPWTSFRKDLFLLIPGVLFLIFGARNSHTLFSKKPRQYIVLGSTVFLLAFAYYFSVEQIPAIDFRPFANGVDVRTKRKAEMDAEAAVKVTGFTIRNTKTGAVAEIPMASYATDILNYKEADGWDKSTIDQIKDEPTVKRTKLSDFTIQGRKTIVRKYISIIMPAGDTILDYDASMLADLGDTTGFKFFNPKKETSVEDAYVEEEILANPNYSFMIVCNKLEKASKSAFKNKINALHAGAEGDGLQFFVASGSTDDNVKEFKKEVGANYVFYTADDILLKTIIRSNPGIVLWKDGVIVKKWHYKHVPSYEDIKKQYMK